MKELSIEEKVKRYDEAIEKLRSLHDNYDTVSTLIDIKEELEDIFPELKESEDEEIRKAIIEHFAGAHSSMYPYKGFTKEQILAWIEKQRQQDKVEPKFRVGDKIRRKTPRRYDKDMQVTRIESNYYLCNHLGKFSSESISFSEESNYELIEQKPAEWSEEDEKRVDQICDDLRCGIINFNAGKIVKGLHFEEIIESNIAWLKELAERIAMQPKQEWSKEDEKMIENIIDTINMSIEDCDVDDIGTKARFSLEKERDWLKNKLKSLRPQNHWKPSDQELGAILAAIGDEKQKGSDVVKELQNIYQQLKKLREE